MNVFATLNQISSELSRIKATVNPDAAVAVDNGRYIYQTAVPAANGSFDITDISGALSASEIIDYLKTV